MANKSYRMSGGLPNAHTVVEIDPTDLDLAENGFGIDIDIDDDNKIISVGDEEIAFWMTEQRIEWLIKHLPIALAEYRKRCSKP